MQRTEVASVDGPKNKDLVIEWANKWGPVALADMHERHGSVFICEGGKVSWWNDSDLCSA